MPSRYPSEDRILFQSVARAIITDSRGTLADQINRRVPAEVRIPRLVPTRTYRPQASADAVAPRDDLILFNGIGGFSPDGREYVIAPARGRRDAGAVGERARQPALRHRRLGKRARLYVERERPPVSPHAVAQRSGERVRAAKPSIFATKKPDTSGRRRRLPARGAAPYVTRHGFGYSVFEHTEDGIRSELTVFVALDAAVKFFVLKVSNQSGRPRRLSATGYVEWVLGDLRAKSAMHVTTEIDARNGALYARNPYNSEFPDWVAFFDVDDPARSVTGDRTEFLGRNGTLARSGRHAPHASVRQGRRRARSLRRDAGGVRSGRRAGA